MKDKLLLHCLHSEPISQRQKGSTSDLEVPPAFPMKLAFHLLPLPAVSLLFSGMALPERSYKADNIQETNYLRSELISVSQQGSAVTPLGLEVPLFG